MVKIIAKVYDSIRDDYDEEVNISTLDLLYETTTKADYMEIISLKMDTVYIPEGVESIFIIDSDIEHVILSSTVKRFGGILEHSKCTIKHITLNENIIEVFCPDCGVLTIDSKFEYLPKLEDVDIRNNKIKCINFRTGYSKRVMVEGNEGIRFKYIHFICCEDLGISYRQTDYLEIATDIYPTYELGYILLHAIRSGETFIDIHKLFTENNIQYL